MSENKVCVCPKQYEEAKITLSLLKKKINKLTNREPYLAGFLLSLLRNVTRVTSNIQFHFDRPTNENKDPSKITAIEKQISDAAGCPAQFHCKEKKEYCHSVSVTTLRI